MCAVYLYGVAALLAWTTVPAVLGLRPVVIVSGSMSPALESGDVVLMASPASGALARGAVAVFDDPARPGRWLTHRIAGENPDGTLRTRGDANAASDSTPVQPSAVKGIGRLVVPMLGVPLVWARQGQWVEVALWLAGTVLALAGLMTLRRPSLAFDRWSTRLDEAGRGPAGDAQPRGRTPRGAWEPPVPGRRRWQPRIAIVVVLAVLGLVTPRLVAAHAQFSGAAGNGGNDFVAATSFCANPGQQTLTPSADAKVDQFSPGTNFGGTADLRVDPRNNRNVRSLVQFALPAPPAGCTMSATLRLYDTTPVAGRTLQAFAAGSAWTEGSVTWTNQPTFPGTAASATTPGAPAWVEFDVTAQVAGQLVGPNQGFVVKDAAEGVGANLGQVFSSRTGANPPQLVLTFAGSPARPPAPAALAATVLSSSRVALTWQHDDTTETGFVVERSLDATSPWAQVGTPAAGATAFTDTGLASSTAYAYRVRAVNAVGASPWSNIATVTTPASPPPPAAPTSLSVTGSGVNSLNLTWTDNAGDEDSFVVERSPAGAGTWTAAGTAGPDSTSFASTGLSANTAYDHRVRAVSNGGYSAWSNTAAGTTATCASASPLALTSVGDAALVEAAPGTNYGSDPVNFGIRSLAGANARSVVTFDLAAFPLGCSLASATLSTYTNTAATGRTLQAWRLAGPWAESTVTWANQPATTGTAASTASATGWVSWVVTGQVAAMLSGSNTGFLLRDATESSATSLTQALVPREGASNRPELVLTLS